MCGAPRLSGTLLAFAAFTRIFWGVGYPYRPLGGCLLGQLVSGRASRRIPGSG